METQILFVAIENGGLGLVEDLVNSNKDWLKAVEKESGLPPLHFACSRGQLPIAKYLIEQKCDPRHPATEAEIFPIHCAIFAEQNSVNLLKYLIEEVGINPHDGNKSGSTPIRLAQQLQNLDAIKYLTETHGCVMDMDLFKFRMEEEQSPHEKESKDTSYDGYLVPTFIMKLMEDDLKFKDDASQMFKTAFYGDLKELEELIKAGSNPHKLEKNGYGPIHAAATEGHLHIVQALVKQYNVNPNEKSKIGDVQPIHCAAMNGHIDVVEYLVKNCGVLPTVKETQYGNEPIHLACSAGKVTMLHKLIELGASLDARLNGDSMELPIHVACVQGSDKIVTELIETYGVDVNANDKMDFFPIHYAARGNKQDTLSLLIEQYKVPPDSRNPTNGVTILHLCAEYGFTDLLSWMCEKYNMDLKVKTYDGLEPIHTAARHGQERIIDMLITKFGIDPNSAADDCSQAIHNAAFNGHGNVVRTLVRKHGVNPLAQSKNDITALHDAAGRGFVDIVLMLVTELGADPSPKTSFDWFQPIHSACCFGHLNVVKALIVESNVNPCEEMKNKAKSIHMASTPEIVDYLVNDCKVNLLAQDEDGETLLHYASGYGWNHIINHLIMNHGVDPMLKAKMNKQAIHMAAAFGQNASLSLFIDQYGIDPRTTTSDLQMQCVHWAALFGKEGIVNALIKTYKSDPEEKAQNGLSPIHFAAYGGSEAVVELLLNEYRVPSCLSAEHNLTPICLAKIGEHSELVELLNSYNQCLPPELELEAMMETDIVKQLKQIKVQTT